MKQYEVRSTKQANEHVLEYAEYIQNELLNQKCKFNLPIPGVMIFICRDGNNLRSH